MNSPARVESIEEAGTSELFQRLTLVDQEYFLKIDQAYLESTGIRRLKQADWKQSIINGDREIAYVVNNEVEKLIYYRNKGGISPEMYAEVQNLAVAQVIRYIRMEWNDIIGQGYAHDLRITPEWVITRYIDDDDTVPF